jgi:GT2 family glycosyltransferase
VTPRPAVTVVVVTFESPHHVVPSVRALRASEGVDLSIIVVDNSLTPSKRDEIRLGLAPFHVTLLATGENLGFTGGNNRGFQVALERGAHWIATVNDDTEIAPDAVRKLVDALIEHPDAAAASPSMLAAAPAGTLWWGGGTLSIPRAIGRHDRYGHALAALPPAAAPVDVTFLTGCAILFRGSVLASLGAFRDDYFMYGEDVELSLRYRRAGFRLLWVPAARLLHKVTVPEPEIAPHKILLRDRNRRRTVRLHYRWWERLVFYGWFVPTRVIHLARYLVRADWARARMILRGAWER